MATRQPFRRTAPARALILAAPILASLAPGAHAADDAVTAGRALAFQLCTSCHLVARDQPSVPYLPNPPASFAAIASQPGVTAGRLADFLRTTHTTLQNPRTMPNPELTPDQIAALTGFILSQRGQADPRGPAPRRTGAEAPRETLSDQIIERSRAPMPRTLDAPH